MHGWVSWNWQRFLAGIAGETGDGEKVVVVGWLVGEDMQEGEGRHHFYIYLKPRLTRPQ